LSLLLRVLLPRLAWLTATTTSATTTAPSATTAPATTVSRVLLAGVLSLVLLAGMLSLMLVLLAGMLSLMLLVLLAGMLSLVLLALMLLVLLARLLLALIALLILVLEILALRILILRALPLRRWLSLLVGSLLRPRGVSRYLWDTRVVLGMRTVMAMTMTIGTLRLLRRRSHPWKRDLCRRRRDGPLDKLFARSRFPDRGRRRRRWRLGWRRGLAR
jgi:hypothetical protein